MQRVRSRRGLLAAIATVLLALWTPASRCAQDDASTASYREVKDEAGRTVRLPKEVRRIVSLAPSATETVYALGLQDKLVGDTDYCEFPAEAKRKPHVGGVINPNLEVVASMHPDVVLLAKSANLLTTVRALEQLGIPSYATDPHTVEQIVASTEKLGDVLGAPEAGEALAKRMNERLETLKQKLAGQPVRRIFFVVWTEPVISAGKNTFVIDAIRHAGAMSIVDSGPDWPQISLEEIIHQQPEYLIFAADHNQDQQSSREALLARPGWNALEAVKNDKIVRIDGAIDRPSPEILRAVEELAKQLHPEAFAEAN